MPEIILGTCDYISENQKKTFPMGFINHEQNGQETTDILNILKRRKINRAEQSHQRGQWVFICATGCGGEHLTDHGP